MPKRHSQERQFPEEASQHSGLQCNVETAFRIYLGWDVVQAVIKAYGLDKL